MKHLKEKLDKLIKTAQQDSEILAVFLFGSSARRQNHKESDIDICLFMKPDDYTSFELSQKKLQYLKLFNMDVQIFQQMPLYIKVRIIKEGEILFCADEEELYEFVFRVIAEFGDFEHIYRDYLKEVAGVR